MDLTLAAIIIMGGWVIAIAAAGLVMVLRPGSAAVRFAPAAAAGPGSTGRRDEILLGGVAEVFGNFRGRVRGVQLRPDNRQIEDVALAWCVYSTARQRGLGQGLNLWEKPLWV